MFKIYEEFKKESGIQRKLFIFGKYINFKYKLSLFLLIIKDNKQNIILNSLYSINLEKH